MTNTTALTIKEITFTFQDKDKAEQQPDDDLLERLQAIHDHDWRASFLAHTSDTALEAKCRIASDAKKIERLEEIASWAQAVLTALNVGNMQQESLLHRKLREVMIAYRAALTPTPAGGE